jgi:hypothetical protein
MFRRCTLGLLRLAVAAILVAAGAPRLRAQSPNPVVGSSVSPAQQDPDAPRVWMPVFQFRNSFWVNLQHYLYLQARIQRGLAVTAGSRPTSPAWAAANLSGLSPAERRAWENAVDYYARHFADYSLPYDSFLVRVDNRLGEMNGCPDITGKSRQACQAGIDPKLTAILEEAAPVYLTHWWPKQQRANHAWIAKASKLVHLYGGKPAEMLASVFDDTWPSDPIPIDVTIYAGAYGAYTTLDTIHISISSVDPRNEGPLALEVVFRESSHAVAWPVERAIINQCHEETKAIPRDLWHALAFYTSSEIFESVFARQPLPGAASASEAAGRASFAANQRAYFAARGWQNYESLLQLYWQPYLNGRADMRLAIDNLVDAL